MMWPNDCVTIYIYIYMMERKWHSMLKGAFNVNNRQLEFKFAILIQ